MRHLLTGFEFSQDEYLDILETASAMKKDPAKYRTTLQGRSGAIMFEKPSLRTRTTFELAFYRLGGHGVYLDLQNGELGKRETIADYSRNLCRWVDCLVGRVFAQSTLEELAKYGSVPVVNAFDMACNWLSSSFSAFSKWLISSCSWISSSSFSRFCFTASTDAAIWL